MSNFTTTVRGSALIAAVAAVGLVVIPTDAATITVGAADSVMTVDAAFAGGGVTGTGDFIDGPFADPTAGNQPALNAGRFQGRVQRPVMTFELPTLGVNEVIIGADFRFSTSSQRNPAPQFGADLEAIGVRSNGAIQIADYQATGTLIEDDLLEPGINSFSNFTLDTTGEAALLSYVTTNYAAGEFLFLRFTPDLQDPPENTRYTIFGDESGAFPRLILETEIIPEPATFGTAMLGLLGLAARRRRS
ncbi:MAG: PEP-CTERM sorting domain-containing protein [Planctomycetota bacterium]